MFEALLVELDAAAARAQSLKHHRRWPKGWGQELRTRSGHPGAGSGQRNVVGERALQRGEVVGEKDLTQFNGFRAGPGRGPETPRIHLKISRSTREKSVVLISMVTKSTTRGSPTGSAKALVKGIAIVDLLASKGGGLRLTDLVNRLDLPRGTVVRLLGVLVDVRLIRRLQTGCIGWVHDALAGDPSSSRHSSFRNWLRMSWTPWSS